MDRIYLDHCATTPLRPEVFAAMEPWLRGVPSNATSAHAFGRDAREAVERAREQVAALVGAHAREVFFTSGGTESNNAAVLGLWEAARADGKTHIVVSAIEHHAVLHAAEWLAACRGAALTVVKPGADGRVDSHAITEAITDKTGLVCLMHGNNETGVLQPVEEVGVYCADRGIPLHCDAVQSAGKVKLSGPAASAATIAISAHKMHGPQGVGACRVRRGVNLEPVALGGSQERGRRAGTENVAGIAGFGAACELAAADREQESARQSQLRNAFEGAVLAVIPGTRINGGDTPRLPHIANIAFEGLEGESLMQALDLEGIAVSTGSACTSGAPEASHVLLAMGQSHAHARAALRFSLGRGTKREQLDRVVERLSLIAARLRAAEPLTPHT